VKAMLIEAGTLKLADVDDPAPGPREVLVGVRATALNRADLSQRAGRYRQQATAKAGPSIAGLESAGEVLEIGSEVTRFAPGDRVMGQCSGGYAELLTVDERLLVRVPATMSWTQAAATPVAFVTEHDAIRTNARLQPGESVLVQAAGAAVGLAAIQVARFLEAGRIYGTVATDEQAALVRELGAEVTIHYERESFEEIVARETDGRGVDVVIDHVGGPVLGANLRSMAVNGRLVSVGRLGPVVGEIDLDLVARNRLQVIGVSFRTRTLDDYGECVAAMVEDLLPALEEGRLRPIVDSVYPLERALEAQERMAANRHLGKIVLSLQP
jgi:NADPH2:quinone reductase